MIGRVPPPSQPNIFCRWVTSFRLISPSALTSQLFRCNFHVPACQIFLQLGYIFQVDCPVIVNISAGITGDRFRFFSATLRLILNPDRRNKYLPAGISPNRLRLLTSHRKYIRLLPEYLYSKSGKKPFPLFEMRVLLFHHWGHEDTPKESCVQIPSPPHRVQRFSL